ncbi:transporter substrate-binding domain-containing protein [Candidatus Gracilibacteria bacterium]|nr:transporter substrate-binding domain-containing protein [Candidatus Gracilibacteria bacterium]
MKKIILILCSYLLMMNSVSAEDIMVGTIEREPFVIQTQEGLTGFSIELSQKIGERLGLELNYKKYDVFEEMLSDVENSKTDFAIANISITSSREKVMDFSHSIFNGGITLMTKDVSQRQLMLYIVSITNIIVALFVLLFYIIGIQFLGKKSINKKNIVLTSILIYCILSVYFFTLYRIGLHNKIQIKDGNIVSGVVGVIEKSTSEDYMIAHNSKYINVKTLSELYFALENRMIDGILHDSPVLKYYTKNNEGYSLEYDILKKEKYGIVFPEKSLLKEKVNLALLELKANGEYEKLYNKYFGEY